MSSAGQVQQLKAKVIKFEGTLAILESVDGQIIRWPIKELPGDIHEGSTVRLIASTAKSEKAAREQLARDVLNTILAG